MKPHTKMISLLALAIAIGSAVVFAEKSNDGEMQASKKEATTSTEKAPATVIIPSENTFEEAKESVEMAITGRGLLVSGTLHVSEMLNRTGKDLGIEKPIFKIAEGLEFCSASISHKMAQVHPSNISVCPFTVVIYELESEPGKTYLSYQLPKLQGDGEKLEAEIVELLQGVAEEGSE